MVIEFLVSQARTAFSFHSVQFVKLLVNTVSNVYHFQHFSSVMIKQKALK